MNPGLTHLGHLDIEASNESFLLVDTAVEFIHDDPDVPVGRGQVTVQPLVALHRQHKLLLHRLLLLLHTPQSLGDKYV